MNVYKLEDFKNWLELSETNRVGMEKWWEYFVKYYEERPNEWYRSIEAGWDRKLLEEVLGDWKEKYGESAKQKVEALQNTIFTWKYEIDSKHKCITSPVAEYIPIIQRTKEEIELRKEISQLKSDLKQEKNKNQKIQDKIVELEQVNRNLKSKCRKQEEQLEELTILRQKLSNAQNQVKELKQKLGINIQTTEKSVQTEFEWEEEIKQKDLKIEELNQQLIKQKQSAKNQQINSNLKDSSWANLVNKNQTGGFIKPSQLKKMRQEQQSTQTQNEIKEQNNQEKNCLIQEQNLIPKK